jgi:hypothetical protein
MTEKVSLKFFESLHLENFLEYEKILIGFLPDPKEEPENKEISS